MTMAFRLSEGALSIILAGGNVEEPVMQILGNKRIANTTSSSTGNDRYRLLVSDGRHLNSFAMLATQLNDKITSGELSDYTVVQITRYITSMITNPEKGDKRVMVILEVKILAAGSEVGFKIGNPKPLTESGEADKSAPAHIAPKPTHTRGLVSGTPIVSHNAASLASPGGSLNTHPISSLSPYQNKWVIKARVTSKSGIRTWANAKGEGKLFSVEFVDESGEIRATAFKEQCDKFYDMLEVGKVYLVSKCQLKTANKKFSNTKNDYEMTFTNETQIVPCYEDSSAIPTLQFDFTPISMVNDMETNAMVDIIGVCKQGGELQSFIARNTNRELKKREVLLVDHSNTAINLTLWGNQAEEFDGSLQPVVAVKGGRINEFGGGKSVSLLQSSVMQINPDIPEAHRLRGWYDNIGVNEEQQNLSLRTGATGGSGGANWMTLKEITLNQLGCGDKADYFSSVCYVLLIRSENCLYKACPSADCNKKVIDQQYGQYRCEKCNREYPNFKFRLLMSVNLADFTGNQWITCFQETGEQLLGIPADELGELQNDSKQFEEVFYKALFKLYNFRLRAKMENYNDENRLKITAVEAKPVKLVEYNEKLINEIQEMVGVKIASNGF